MVPLELVNFVVKSDLNYTEVLGVKCLKRTFACRKGFFLKDIFKLSVHVSDACPCSCKFCCNSSKGFFLDVEKFKRDYELINKQCVLDDVYFTGGEPMIYWDKIKECISVIEQRVTINTMGLNLDHIDIPVNVSLSRHHWDHATNEQILGVKLPIDYIKRFHYKKKMNLACNIIKDYVDDEEDMRKMLDFAMDNKIPLVSFVGLMPLNDYSKEFGVQVPKITGDDILPYREFNYQNNTCHCANFCYHKNGNFQLFYTRHNQCPSDNHGGRLIYRNGIQPWFSK